MNSPIKFYLGHNGQKFYPSPKNTFRGKPMTLGKCWAICELLNSGEMTELELATSDILPGVAEAGASVAGRGSRS